MKYHLTLVPVRFFEGFVPSYRGFEAPDDEAAIQHSENPPVPLRFVIPNGEGTCASVPRKLIEDTEPPRVVKEW